jgi:hypothetical protein
MAFDAGDGRIAADGPVPVPVVPVPVVPVPVVMVTLAG